MARNTLFYLFCANKPGYLCSFNWDTFEVAILTRFSRSFRPTDIAISSNVAYGIRQFHDRNVFENINFGNLQLDNDPNHPELWHEASATVYFNSKLYYIGSYHESQNNIGMSTVLTFNGNLWNQQIGAPIRITDIPPSSVVNTVNNRLYIANSENRDINCLHSDGIRWSDYIGSMLYVRDCVGVASHRGKIYLTGGKHYNDVLSLCESFSNNFDEGIAVQNTRLARMKNNRHHHSLIVANEKLYAIGGYSKTDDEGQPVEFCTAIEEYNIDENEWKTLKQRCKEPNAP